MGSIKWSLTEHLLSTYADEHARATQHPFLLAAAEGRLPKSILGRWLANDRLYIHAYIKAAGKMLASIDLPQTPPPPGTPGGEATETQLADWLIEALAAVRKEERLFIDVAERYELGVHGNSNAKLVGLTMIEDIFDAIQLPGAAGKKTSTVNTLAGARATPTLLPFLEGAVTFWGTERCYLDAWSWAKSKEPLAMSLSEDADGGALRREFIPNWSSLAFSQFVGRLGGLVDSAVSQVLEGVADESERSARKEEILARVEGKWKPLLAAEAAFWPQVE
ncbi:hypothetical protein B0T26DRAFT_640431 [Lasiosphaeria miniovina]|uniref:Thiaminase-2/PQQC domain-containing protein n=1 Tax=Lasiosphaeria miniovina TaxID=1954250 RepID=A0AA40E2C3_9PEZI|nr:uncharacterized protein B0T26DRAFT_640431 [Lasiosphaeria miniovina]KAK0721671.1 hypothetical protein B0T26DRAFT_640431 [Lasiosphaeria miniovina]